MTEGGAASVTPRRQTPPEDPTTVQITESDVRKALASVRYATGGEDVLLGLAAVESRLESDGIADTIENARWALHAFLDEVVWSELARLSHTPRDVDRLALTPAVERDMIRSYFRTGSPELEGWGVLYVRYLSTAGIQMSELPDLVGVSRATVARRLNSAMSHLTNKLRELERDAITRRGDRSGRPATERIVVTGVRAGDTPDEEALSALLAVACDDRRVARLSPEQLGAIARISATDLTGYRLGRIAEWSLPRYRLDDRFVDLSLLIDQGEEEGGDRWRVQEKRFAGLVDVLAAMADPALVLLGPPGSGKSTLLRRLELDTAVAGLRGGDNTVTFLIPLNQFRATRPGGPLPAPREWLSAQWSSRFPDLPPLDELLDRGSVLLLLDALNEIPHADAAEYRAHVLLWKQFVQEVVAGGRGNRVVLSCRSLEYSAPISTPELRVPQVRIEPLSDEQVERFLGLYSPGRSDLLWDQLRDEKQLDLVRSPYFLKLYVDHVSTSGRVPTGRAALFSGFVREALRREVRRDNSLFLPGSLLTERDYNRVVRVRRWGSVHELPTRGPLFPKLAELAYRMQRGEPLGEAAQVRVPYDAAIDLLDDAAGDTIIRAGVSMAVLDEDTDRDEVLFVHQLVQEYFAGRHMAQDLDPELVRVEWRGEEQEPTASETLELLGPAEPLPPLPLTHWEETTLLAAEIAEDKASFVEELVDVHVALAGRCAAQSGVYDQLPDRLLERLRQSLLMRSNDAEADLRARIEAGLALGLLGDPRFVMTGGPDGPFRLPVLVRMPAGVYPIGSDEVYEAIGKSFDDQVPAHVVDLTSFELGRYPVTNAEYRCFMDAGGYDDDRWWDTATARNWRRGVGTAAGERQRYHYWTRVFRAEPTFLDELLEFGRVDDEAFERWRRWMAMEDDQLEAELVDEFPDTTYGAPGLWDDPGYDNPSQPVVSVSWHEARAYCLWLSAQTGRAFRLPTEAEREAAGRGFAGRLLPYGDEMDTLRGNVLETHLQRPTPVGTFPDGETPEGISDISGNVSEWTSTRWGADPERPEFRYPYRSDDGREAPEAPVDCRRVLRGGAFYLGAIDSVCQMRARHHPTARDAGIGFRVSVSDDD